MLSAAATSGLAAATPRALAAAGAAGAAGAAAAALAGAPVPGPMLIRRTTPVRGGAATRADSGRDGDEIRTAPACAALATPTPPDPPPDPPLIVTTRDPPRPCCTACAA